MLEVAGYLPVMIDFVSRNRVSILFLLILFLLFLMMSLQVRRGGTNPVRQGITLVISPMQHTVHTTISYCGSVWSDYVFLINLKEENKRLKEELRRQKVRLLRADYLDRSIRHLETLLDFKEKLDYEVVVARVIAADYSNPERTRIMITLDRGREKGLYVNSPVLTSEGIVGKVVSTTFSTAVVEMINHSNSGISARVERDESVVGVVVGRNGSRLVMEYVKNLDDIRENDLVVSAGFDGIYPPGYPIGRVSSVKTGEWLFKEVMIQPAVNLSSLERVFVLKKKKEMNRE